MRSPDSFQQINYGITLLLLKRARLILKEIENLILKILVGEIFSQRWAEGGGRIWWTVTVGACSL